MVIKYGSIDKIFKEMHPQRKLKEKKEGFYRCGLVIPLLAT
jgi:hypothetical protein